MKLFCLRQPEKPWTVSQVKILINSHNVTIIIGKIDHIVASYCHADTSVLRSEFV